METSVIKLLYSTQSLKLLCAPKSLDLNKIYNIDCIEGMKEIPDNYIDLIVTDPPYLISYKTNRRKESKINTRLNFNTVIQNDDNPELIEKYIKECHRIMKNDTAMYIFCSWKTADIFKQELEKYFEIKNQIIWDKGNHTAGDLEAQFGQTYEIMFLVNKGRCKFNGERINDMWFFPKVTGKEQVHQNQKPQPLIEQCIMKHSKENDIVFDGFMGSGTTAFAAKRLKRNFIGFEIEKNYCDEANKKINRITAHTVSKQVSLFS